MVEAQRRTSACLIGIILKSGRYKLYETICDDFLTMKLNANLTLRACAHRNQLQWEDSPAAGVQRLRLECEDDNHPVERVTTVVRFAAESSFRAHVHSGGEEILVLDGVFSDQHADYPIGYYVRNPPGSSHIPQSKPGCTILVKLWQMQPGDQQHVAIDTRDPKLWQTQLDGSQKMNLFEADYETVEMLRWPAGLALKAQVFAGGAEYFVIEGGFSDQHDRYEKGSWLRLPAGSTQHIEVRQDCLVWRKTGHLLNPVRYA